MMIQVDRQSATALNLILQLSDLRVGRREANSIRQAPVSEGHVTVDLH